MRIVNITKEHENITKENSKNQQGERKKLLQRIVTIT